MQVCTSLQTDNHASTSSLSFLQAGCPSCRPTNSVKGTEGKIISVQQNFSDVYQYVYVGLNCFKIFVYKSCFRRPPPLLSLGLRPCLWRVFAAGDSQQVVVAPAVTTTAVRLTSTHERSVDVAKWRRTDIDVWLDSNDLKHLAHW